MGFYGNVTNTNRTQFVFDRVFANRAEMDGYVTELEAEDGLKYWSDINSDEEAQKNVEKDSVFVGRYVLVDYDKEVLNKLPYRRVYKEKYGNYTYFYFDSSLNINTIAKCFTETHPQYSNLEVVIEENYYITDDNGNTIVNPLAQKEEYSSYIFNDEIVYSYENNQITYYKLKEVGQLAQSISKDMVQVRNAAPLVEIELTKEEKEKNNLFDYYYNNSNIDRRVYNNTGRGWDSTVWQKTYSDGKSKYVMIAELNSVVPSFAVSVDPPTLLPMAPHFGSDSTNVFYRLHTQPNWGFRIKKAEDDQNSDYQVKLEGNNWIYDEEAKVWKWIKDYDLNYSGAIYYNKDGFDSLYRTAKEDSEDTVSLAPTGMSGQKYNTHDGTEKAEQVDIQELTVNLPSIGNAVSKMWDLVYGEGEETTEENIYLRNQNIDWNSHAGLRLVKEKDDGTGYEYDTKKVETLAGCINSVHDLMGMIVLTADSWTDPNEALEDYIYYKRDADSNEYGYFIKDLTYTFTDEEGDSVQELVELKDFNEKDYYALQEGSYYFANAYRNGGKYYAFINNPTEVPLASKDYKKETYYIKEGNSYYLDTSDKPTDGKDYYYIPKTNSGNKEVVNNVKTYFFPTSETYYNNLINSKKPTEEDSEINYGLFYLGENERFYPFKLNETSYKQYLYWWVGYTLKDEVQKDGTTVQVYDTSIGTRTQYEMKQFVKNTYFCQEEDSSDYLFLNSEDDIDLEKTYYSFPDEVVPTQIAGNINGTMTNFYAPNKYFYLEGKNYIYAKEESKLKNTYYTISFENDVEAITDLFYEPNKYYYFVDGEYVLDTNPGWTEGRVYYNSYEKYVKEDTADVFSVGAKWPLNITKPESVTLGIRRPKWQWKKLEGFSRSLNTINGLIIKINQILKFDDELTRDTKTVQGCINTLNDIIKKFDRLTPGRITMVNQYGQIVSAEENSGDDWIAVSVDPVSETISITHKDPVETIAEAKTAVEPKFGETFEIEDWIFDEKGHKYDLNTHTVKIPQGSYTDDIAINGQKVITKLELNATSGAITSNSADLMDVLVDTETTLRNRLSSIDDTIAQEISDRKDAITQEVSDRNAAIKEAVDNETEARSKADEILQTNIDNETKAREAVDNALSGRISTLEEKSSTWDAAEENAKKYANSLAENYDKAGAANEALAKAQEYTDNAMVDVIKSTDTFSYNNQEMTIQGLFNYIAELEARIVALESPGGEEEA